MNARIETVSAEDFARLLRQQDCTIVDVRSGSEYRSERLANSLHIPLQDLSGTHEALTALPADRTLYLLCQSGKRAQAAADRLCTACARKLVVIDGGLNALKQHKVETEHQTEGLSLERQVRIAAGALVIIGVLLGALLHPAGYALSAIVGAGLVLAGATNWCGMGLLLARMPWNR